MQKVSLMLAAALVVAAGFLATGVQAKEKPCKVHKTQAECTADNACAWSAKNKCVAQAKK